MAREIGLYLVRFLTKKIFFGKEKTFVIDSEQFVYKVPEKAAMQKNNQSSGFYRQKCNKIMFWEQKKYVRGP